MISTYTTHFSSSGKRSESQQVSHGNMAGGGSGPTVEVTVVIKSTGEGQWYGVLNINADLAEGGFRFRPTTILGNIYNSPQVCVEGLISHWRICVDSHKKTADHERQVLAYIAYIDAMVVLWLLDSKVTLMRALASEEKIRDFQATTKCAVSSIPTADRPQMYTDEMSEDQRGQRDNSDV